MKKSLPMYLCLALLISVAVCCSGQVMEIDRFTDAIVAASSKNLEKATFSPRHNRSYELVMLKGPQVDRGILEKAGLTGARLDALLQAAPRDFELAVTIITPQTYEVGWFLGNYVIGASSMAASKQPGEPIVINLRYGGSLPEILSIE